MLVIRFQRVGRRNDPAFRIVVTEKRSKPKSGELEIVGSFHPKTKEARLNRDRILHWLSQGAKASARVHNFLVDQAVITGRKINVAKPPAAQAARAEPSEEAAGATTREMVVPASVDSKAEVS